MGEALCQASSGTENNEPRITDLIKILDELIWIRYKTLIDIQKLKEKEDTCIKVYNNDIRNPLLMNICPSIHGCKTSSLRNKFVWNL